MTTWYGGPDSVTAGGFASGATQAMVFPVATTLTRVRSAWNAVGSGGKTGGGRVGFSATKPNGPASVVWLGYADIADPPVATYVDAPLSSPITVAAGQTLWAVAVGSALGQYIDGDKGTLVGGVTVPGDPFYTTDVTATSSWSGQTTGAGWRLNIQGGADPLPPSGQLWPRRKPGARPASGQLWPRG